MLLITISVSSCVSCVRDKDKDGKPDKEDKCPDVFAKTKDGCPQKENQINSIQFYIDKSKSMGGYFNKAKDTEFRTIVTDLTAKIEKTIKPTSIWLITDKVKGPFRVQDFSTKMATESIANADGYQLHGMISNITSSRASNDITILVSDYILSYPDAEIRDNPEINKTNAPTDLKNKVFSTFFDLKNQGISTSIYAFKSKFYGTYYDYRNGKTELDGSIRPFYIWVMANRELLSQFNSKITEISTFRPEKSLHFGFSEKAITEYNIIPQIEREGKWMTDESNHIKDVEFKANKILQFSIGINLDDLPDYAKEIKYLQSNLKLDVKGCAATLEVKDKSTVDKSRLRSNKQIQDFENATHIIVFKLNSMSLSQAQIKVTLPLLYDTWYLDWSTMNDKDASSWNSHVVSASRGKTFSLEHLISGVKEAYTTPNRNFIELSITLNK